jgi:tyrosine-protein phosphatase SIW14
VYMPLVRNGVTDAELERFFQIVDDPSQQPVLVHCHAGSRRTGVMVAAYRIAVQGWSYEDAMAEAETFRFRADKDKVHDDVLRNLAAEGAPRHRDVGPTARTNP